MDVLALPLPAGWAIGGWIAAAVLVAPAAWTAPWSRFRDNEFVHVWYGGIFFVVVLWSIQATVGAGFTFHLLGVAALTLSMGPALALVGTAIAIGVAIAVRDGLWANAGIGCVTMAALPMASTWLVLRAAERFLPPNFFVYVFFGAFLGGALSLAGAGLAGTAVMTLAAGVPAERVWGEYAPYLVYLAFGEGTLTGMLLTLGVVYRPRWVTTFDDARYLKGR